MILIILSLAWILGIFLGSIFNLSPLFLFCGLLPFAGFAFTRNHKKLIILLSLSVLALVGGMVRYAANVPDNNNMVQTYNGSAVNIKGTIDRDPEAGDKVTQFELSGLAISLNGEWHKIGGKTLLFVPNPTEFRYGDVLQADGNLETPPQLDDFDYRGYLANQGIYSIMSYPSVENLETGKGNPVIGWVYSLRHRMSDSLVRILPEPQASLAQGIILGLRGNIPQDLKGDFSASGTTHILAISGQNLSILAGILISLGIWLFGRRHYYYIWLALAVIWIYTIFTGISPPVVRAAIMVSLFLFADMFGRQRSAGPALTLAAAVMIGISPNVLWNPSFQLSVLAMGGLVLISPHFQNFTRNIVTNKLGETGFRVSAANIILDSFDVTLASLIAVWPVIAYYFGIISLVAPISTLLAVPALTGIIVMGIIAGGLGILWLPMGLVSGWVAWLFLSYLILIVKVAAATPHSSIPMTTVNPMLMWIYYSLLLVIIWLVVNRKKIETIRGQVKSIITRAGNVLIRFNKAWIAVPLLIAAILLTATAFTIPDNELHVSFLDVGQGDAILIRQGNQEVLVDGGPDTQAISRELGKQLPFWDRTIELVVSTHPDSDHLTGLVEVLRRYGVGQVVCPDFPSDSLIYTQWGDLLAEKDVKTTIAQSGQTINFGNGIRIEVLSPTVPAGFTAGSDDNGVVLRLTDGKVSFLLTGDISAQGEFALIAERADLESSVLKVAHHGSAGSTSEEFLDAVNPQAAVISVGKNNDYGHPTTEVLDRLTNKIGENNIYRTDKDGTAEFITDGQRLWVDTKGSSSNS